MHQFEETHRQDYSGSLVPAEGAVRCFPAEGLELSDGCLGAGRLACMVNNLALVRTCGRARTHTQTHMYSRSRGEAQSNTEGRNHKATHTQGKTSNHETRQQAQRQACPCIQQINKRASKHPDWGRGAGLMGGQASKCAARRQTNRVTLGLARIQEIG